MDCYVQGVACGWPAVTVKTVLRVFEPIERHDSEALSADLPLLR